MLRDRLKSKEYFDSYIDELENLIKLMESDLAKGNIKEDRVFPVRNAMCQSKLKLLKARYSRGDEIMFLRESLLDVINDFFFLDNERFFTYTRNLEVISLALLLNIPDDILNKIENKVYEKDGLIEFIVSKGSKKKYDELAHPKGWQMLFTIISLTDKEQQTNQLKEFIFDVWVKFNEEEGAFESHKNKKVNSYSGYWCFESAAVAKILAIPDDDLKDSPYYPYDLVHMED